MSAAEEKPLPPLTSPEVTLTSLSAEISEADMG